MLQRPVGGEIPFVRLLDSYWQILGILTIIYWRYYTAGRLSPKRASDETINEDHQQSDNGLVYPMRVKEEITDPISGVNQVDG